jgi:hypothetical protein
MQSREAFDVLNIKTLAYIYLFICSLIFSIITIL